MIDKFIERAAVQAARMNERERRLALIVLLLAPVCLFFLLCHTAYGYVRDLDGDIDGLRADIVDYNFKISKREEVEERYAKIAAQHSSEWSEAEILDRLRQELFRLAEKLPPPLDKEGKPVRTINKVFGALVAEPELGPGSLREGGEGYKEFALSFHVPRDDFYDVIDYLERLQDSPQMLRIDRLIINRIHNAPTASADLDITRTVVTGSGETPVQVKSADEIDAPPIAWELADWRAEGCATQLSETRISTGASTLEVLAKEAGARFYLERPLASGGVYDMLVDIKAEGPCRLGIQAAGGEAVFSGERMLPPNGRAYRYHVQFTVPGGDGDGNVNVYLPVITLETAGAKVFVENVVIAPLEE